MKEALYLSDSYLKEFEAEVVSVNDGKFIVLDKTAFYPRSGGQPHDEGVMVRDGEKFKVVFVGKFDGKISHEVDHEGLKVGDKVSCKIDWERRHKLMRMHTAAHILCEVINRESGALITGNQLDVEKSRIDFSLENYDPEKMNVYVGMANDIVKKDLPVSVKFVTRSEAMEIPQVSKLAKGLPESIKEVRLLYIGDFDIQADGGTHVKSTAEVGKIVLLKCENKGKNNRRLYYSLE